MYTSPRYDVKPRSRTCRLGLPLGGLLKGGLGRLFRCGEGVIRGVSVAAWAFERRQSHVQGERVGARPMRAVAALHQVEPRDNEDLPTRVPAAMCSPRRDAMSTVISHLQASVAAGASGLAPQPVRRLDGGEGCG